MKAVTEMSATVYKGGRRRYFTKSAAYIGAARAIMKANCECTPDHDLSPEDGFDYGCDYCDLTTRGSQLLLTRLARWLRWRDGRIQDSEGV